MSWIILPKETAWRSSSNRRKHNFEHVKPVVDTNLQRKRKRARSEPRTRRKRREHPQKEHAPVEPSDNPIVQEQNRKLKLIITLLREKLLTADHKITDLLQDNASLREKNVGRDRLSTKLKDVEFTAGSAMEEIAILKADLNQAVEERNLLRMKYSNVETDKSSLVDAFESLKEKYRSLRDECEAMQQRSDKAFLLESKIEELKLDLENMYHQKTVAEEDKERIANKYSDLEAVVSTVRSQTSAVEASHKAQIVDLQTQLKKSRNLLLQSESQKGAFEERMRQAEADLEKARNTNYDESHLNQELEQLRKLLKMTSTNNGTMDAQSEMSLKRATEILCSSGYVVRLDDGESYDSVLKENRVLLSENGRLMKMVKSLKSVSERLKTALIDSEEKVNVLTRELTKMPNTQNVTEDGDNSGSVAFLKADENVLGVDIERVVFDQPESGVFTLVISHCGYGAIASSSFAYSARAIKIESMFDFLFDIYPNQLIALLRFPFYVSLLKNNEIIETQKLLLRDLLLVPMLRKRVEYREARISISFCCKFLEELSEDFLINTRELISNNEALMEHVTTRAAQMKRIDGPAAREEEKSLHTEPMEEEEPVVVVEDKPVQNVEEPVKVKTPEPEPEIITEKETQKETISEPKDEIPKTEEVVEEKTESRPSSKPPTPREVNTKQEETDVIGTMQVQVFSVKAVDEASMCEDVELVVKCLGNLTADLRSKPFDLKTEEFEIGIAKRWQFTPTYGKRLRRLDFIAPNHRKRIPSDVEFWISDDLEVNYVANINLKSVYKNGDIDQMEIEFRDEENVVRAKAQVSLRAYDLLTNVLDQ
ncbi:hypothetical protein PCE1_004579 [Barthelona sp. PCE]